MEQTLTTAAFISAALFIVWILLVDPAADDVHAGLDMTFLGALLMVPVIIFILAGIALLFPVIFAIALIGLILYGLFMLLRWFITREKTEASSDPPKEGRVLASLRRIEKGVKALGKSRAVTASRERVRDSTVKVRAALTKGSHKARDTYRDTAQKVRESPKNFKESVARVKEGAAKKVDSLRAKLDRTIAAGKERSRKLHEQGAKNTADASKPHSHRRKADNAADSVTREKGADRESVAEHRDSTSEGKVSRSSNGTIVKDDRHSRNSHMRSEDSEFRPSDQSRTAANHSSNDQKHSARVHAAQAKDVRTSREIQGQSHTSSSRDSSRNASHKSDASIDQKSGQTTQDTEGSKFSGSEKHLRSDQTASEQDAASQGRSSQHADVLMNNVSEGQRFSRLGSSMRDGDFAGKNRQSQGTMKSEATGDSKTSYYRFLKWTRKMMHKLEGAAAKKPPVPSKVNAIHGIRRGRLTTDADLFSEEYLRNMRPIGWKTRSKMDETYHRDEE